MRVNNVSYNYFNKINDYNMNKSFQKLSSGKKVNSAADNVANLGIINKLTSNNELLSLVEVTVS